MTFGQCGAPDSTVKPVPDVELGVLNATGVRRLGRAVEMELLNRGFNVFRVGDTNVHFVNTSVVDLRDPEGRRAKAVAEALAKDERFLWFFYKRRIVPAVLVHLDSSQYLDVQIILGDDYKKFFPGAIPLY